MVTKLFCWFGMAGLIMIAPMLLAHAQDIVTPVARLSLVEVDPLGLVYAQSASNTAPATGHVVVPVLGECPTQLRDPDGLILYRYSAGQLFPLSQPQIPPGPAGRQIRRDKYLAQLHNLVAREQLLEYWRGRYDHVIDRTVELRAVKAEIRELVRQLAQ